MDGQTHIASRPERAVTQLEGQILGAHHEFVGIQGQAKATGKHVHRDRLQIGAQLHIHIGQRGIYRGFAHLAFVERQPASQCAAPLGDVYAQLHILTQLLYIDLWQICMQLALPLTPVAGVLVEQRAFEITRDR